MGLVNFGDLSADLQQEVREAKPMPSMRGPNADSAERALRDRMFWVRKDGHISRAKGHWKLTPKAAAALDRQIKAMSDPGRLLDPPGKGSLREWKPGVAFSLDVPNG